MSLPPLSTPFKTSFIVRVIYIETCYPYSLINYQSHTFYLGLNTQSSSPSSIRPVDLISVLSSPSSARFNSLFNSREHQDAQELFQLVSECIKNETINVDKEGLRDHGLNALSQEAGINPEIGKSVFDGLTANRRSCVICGYTEAVMHFAFDNWQLAVPRMAVRTFCSVWMLLNLH